MNPVESTATPLHGQPGLRVDTWLLFAIVYAAINGLVLAGAMLWQRKWPYRFFLELHPVALFFFFFAATGAACVSAYLWTDNWDSRYAAAGFCLALFAYLNILWELLRSARLQEEKQAARRQGAERIKLVRYEWLVHEVSRLFIATQHDVARRQWRNGTRNLQDFARNSDMIQQMQTPDKTDDRWSTLAQRALRLASLFQSGQDSRPLVYDNEDWLGFCYSGQSVLNNELLSLEATGSRDDTTSGVE